MSDASPTFSLPACPVCSNPIVLERPFWRFAHNTSRARKRNCYAFTGCAHAGEAGDPNKIYDDPETWSLVEDAWALRVEQLFDERTEKWEPGPKEALRRALSGKTVLPGMTEPLDLSPAHPAQQEPTKAQENGHED